MHAGKFKGFMIWAGTDNFQKHYSSKRIQGPCEDKKAIHLSSLPEAFLDTPSLKISDYQNRWAGNRQDRHAPERQSESPQRRKC